MIHGYDLLILEFLISSAFHVLLTHLLLTTYYLLPTTYYLPPTTYYLLLTTSHLLPTTYYLLLTTYYLLPPPQKNCQDLKIFSKMNLVVHLPFIRVPFGFIFCLKVIQ